MYVFCSSRKERPSIVRDSRHKSIDILTINCNKIDTESTEQETDRQTVLCKQDTWQDARYWNTEAVLSMHKLVTLIQVSCLTVTANWLYLYRSKWRSWQQEGEFKYEKAIAEWIQRCFYSDRVLWRHIFITGENWQ